MPQGRIVLKSICQSKKLAELKTDGARLLFTWLIPNLDINGCFSGDAEVVKGQVFTRLKKSSKIIDGYMQDMAAGGLIFLYSVNNDTFLCVPDFSGKQPNLNASKEAKPTIPPPTPEQLKSNSGFTPRKVKESKGKQSKEEVKEKYLDFVSLSKNEHQKLIKKFGQQDAEEKIANLDGYIGSKGDKYKSHYRTILNWERRNRGQNAKATQKPTKKPKEFIR